MPKGNGPTLLNLNPAGGNPSLIWNAGDGQVLLFNRSISNQILLSDDPGVSQQGQVPLDPLGSLTLDPDWDVWGISAGPGQTALAVIPDGITQNPSAVQIAESITASGVNLIQATNIALNPGALAIAASTINSSGIVSIVGVSYEIAATMSSASATNQPVRWIVTWYDGSGNQVAIDRFQMFPGTVALPHNIVIRGQAKSSMCKVQVQNTDATVPITVSYFLYGSSTTYTRDELRTQNNGTGNLASPNITYITGFDVTSNTVGNYYVSVPAGNTVARTLPAYAGLVNIQIGTASGTNDCTWFVRDQAREQSDASWGAAEQIASGTTSATGGSFIAVALPRSQCLVSVKNGNAVAQIISVNIQVQEEPG
jgi:hypothetical protein